ncbi:hypothetical protein EXE58_18445 [Nocardioides seonyuensis]|uniref:Secreted protein n=1 Tax=Nocardioides seonyuensis TaxID=2518371 RepID=A0A4P7IIG1_9ACTN|nr:DUF6167 family protein [Nocardioides seonyuensis]QBX57209.1 hypothetical protein EXE58_18445 [Nocardioides seonyuensis]
MARSFWFVAGAGAGVYAMSRARRLAEVATVEGVRDRLEAMRVGARIFRDEVAAGQAEKETELRQRLGLVPHGVPELTSSGPRRSQDDLLDQRTKRETPDGHQ